MAHSLLAHTANPLSLPMCLIDILFLESSTFLSPLPLSEQFVTTARIHMLRHEEYSMVMSITAATTYASIGFATSGTHLHYLFILRERERACGGGGRDRERES